MCGHDTLCCCSTEARSRLLASVGSLKRAGETANVLAQLLPGGGKASKLRRGVMHLAETNLLSTLVAGAGCEKHLVLGLSRARPG